MTSYWINTVSLDHVERGVAGGFTQADHGRSTSLQKLVNGDWLAFYSPRTSFPDGASLQQFTAVAQVVDDVPYQVEVSPDFRPWRRRVEFVAAQPAAVRPLLDELAFIADKQHWGYPFRRGLFTISDADFSVIAAAMNVVLSRNS